MIYSSLDPRIPAPFSGWCWVGNDLVVGSQGAVRYQQERGRPIKPGLDGCYVCVEHTPEGLLLGTDSRGLARLFLYRDSTSWAVGSSLSGLAAHLRAHGKYINPNKATLAPLSRRSNFTSQLTSTETILQGVELIPSYIQVLVTSSGRFELIENEVRTPTDNYEVSLGEYINTWRSRLSTLLISSDTNISVDLSGGLDSRTVLAFFTSLRDLSAPNTRFRVSSSVTRKKDFKVASRIAASFGFELNGKLPQRPKKSQLAALKSWEDHSLGVYNLVYFDGSYPDPKNIHAHGAGGENFRPIYRGANMQERIALYSANVPSELYPEWEDSVLRTTKNLKQRNPYVSPIMLHYREFRNRLHFGHKPHNNIVFTPLNSGMTDALTDGDGGVDPQQFYFDIMESLSPGLQEFPYDDKRKMPRDHHRAEVTRVELLDPSPGQVFGESNASTLHSVGDPRSAYERWIDEASQAIASENVKRFLWGDLHENSERALASALSGVRLASNSREIARLSFVMSAHFALDGRCD